LPLIVIATELRFDRLWSYRHLAERQCRRENFDENRFHSRSENRFAPLVVKAFDT
jgi:hypothetical protein